MALLDNSAKNWNYTDTHADGKYKSYTEFAITWNLALDEIIETPTIESKTEPAELQEVRLDYSDSSERIKTALYHIEQENNILKSLAQINYVLTTDEFKTAKEGKKEYIELSKEISELKQNIETQRNLYLQMFEEEINVLEVKRDAYVAVIKKLVSYVNTDIFMNSFENFKILKNEYLLHSERIAEVLKVSKTDNLTTRIPKVHLEKRKAASSITEYRLKMLEELQNKIYSVERLSKDLLTLENGSTKRPYQGVLKEEVEEQINFFKRIEGPRRIATTMEGLKKLRDTKKLEVDLKELKKTFKTIEKKQKPTASIYKENLDNIKNILNIIIHEEEKKITWLGQKTEPRITKEYKPLNNTISKMQGRILSDREAHQKQESLKLSKSELKQAIKEAEKSIIEFLEEERKREQEKLAKLEKKQKEVVDYSSKSLNDEEKITTVYEKLNKKLNDEGVAKALKEYTASKEKESTKTR